MGKTPKWNAETGSSFLVVELVHYWKGARAGVEAIVSVPGRDGTMSRHWAAASGILDADQVSDLTAWLALSSRNALVRWTGYQESLPI